MPTDLPARGQSKDMDELLAPLNDAHEARRRPRKRVRKRRKATVTGVLGEILITAGVLVLGFIVWQPIWSSTVVANQTATASQAQRDQWEANAQPSDAEGIMYDEDIPLPTPAAPGEHFGILYAPAFGPGFRAGIGGGTDVRTVLNNYDLGIGHYSNTQLPGEVGNFAIAAHRSGWVPTPFREIMNLRVGDPLVVETENGYYTYRFRNVEYVLPTQVDVLNPFPRLEGQPGVDRILTMTTCHPKLSGSLERAIGYAVFESFQPRSAGMPQELIDLDPTLQS
ncbi:class E sortase [Lysinibacter sp. HNR]|uniref:class E sortase n=1 Tax=Lysinibacter sp. HNR TaxID=3031408 RepID=UPI002434DCC4|nr:class E sortase [Lysinibacter sp. HNR]WGD37357.1 class E sortase [Lysinibacter sp. HNR]